MRALVIYESMYGNTHRIAEEIAAGLGDPSEVVVVPVHEVTSEQVAAAELLIVGGPTHVHGVSRASSRAAAVAAAAKPGSGLTCEPGATELGLREWLRAPRRIDARVAAFDTRMHGRRAFTGSAAWQIDRRLRQRGGRRDARPESFVVDRNNVLDDGELRRARKWGRQLATAAPTAAARPISS